MSQRSSSLGWTGAVLLVLLGVLSPLLSGCPPRSSQAASPALEPARTVSGEPFSPRLSIVSGAENQDEPLHQGRAFLVKVSDDSGLIASIRARWADQTIPCFPDATGSVWYGVGGVGRELLPGEYELAADIETTHGNRLQLKKNIRVESTVYATAELSVAPAMAKVPEELKHKVEEDRRAFREVWAHPVMGMLWSGAFQVPVEGRVTSTFGEQRIFNKEVNSVHGGVDLAAGMGVPISATASGRVALVRSCYIEGGTVVVDHGGGLYTYYCHLSEYSVKEGQMIDKGEVVGLAGATGRVTGPHLHWGCRVQGMRVDPLSLLELVP